MLNGFARIGRRVLDQIELGGFGCMLMFRSIWMLPNALVRWRTILSLNYESGIQSLSVVMLFSVISGAVLCLMTGGEMARWGLQDFIGAIVILSMFRELGPLMTAIILLGRVGSSMAAELGTMAVSEEIDALETMAIDPVRFLVMPRLITMAMIGPVLTLFSAIVGSVGGMFVAQTQIGVDPIVYFRNAQWIMEQRDVWWGILKGFIFSITIGVVACAYGLRTWGGALGVGRTSRNTVVTALVLIIYFNYILSAIFLGIFPAGS